MASARVGKLDDKTQAPLMFVVIAQLETRGSTSCVHGHYTMEDVSFAKRPAAGTLLDVLEAWKVALTIKYSLHNNLNWRAALDNSATQDLLLRSNLFHWIASPSRKKSTRT